MPARPILSPGNEQLYIRNALTMFESTMVLRSTKKVLGTGLKLAVVNRKPLG